MKKNDVILKKHIIPWAIGHTWLILIILVIIFAIFQFNEHIQKMDVIKDPYFWTEVLLFFLILSAVGYLLEFLKEAASTQQRTMKILNYKHNLLMDLAKFEDWDGLISSTVSIPRQITAVQESALYFLNPISEQFELAIRWSEDVQEGDYYSKDFQNELLRVIGLEFTFDSGQSRLLRVETEPSQPEYYYLLNSLNTIFGVIWFNLEKDTNLTSEQKDILENIGDEISLALKAGQDYKKYLDLQMAEIAMSERRTISHYLHDNLSQNLVFLKLKVRQLINESFLLPSDILNNDLQRMEDAIANSYEIVRGKIESNFPETTLNLSNLFLQHARKVSARSNLNISVHKTGNPLPITHPVQQAIFYVFQEVLSNVEKHAIASKVDVKIDWNNDLYVTISDDGIGFDPQIVDINHHFGLSIMQERIEKVNGWIKFNSQKDSGTIVTIFVPKTMLFNRETRYAKPNQFIQSN